MQSLSELQQQPTSKIAFGCEPLSGTDWGDVCIDEIIQAIHLAVEKGVVVFDTADVYGLGLSEKRLAQALGEKAHDMLIMTKGGVRWQQQKSDNRTRTFRDVSKDYLIEACEHSLERLNLECIPIYLAHWPDHKTPLTETFEALTKLKQQGKVKYIGCSNFSLEQLKEIVITDGIDLDVIQIKHNILMLEENEPILTFCQENHITIFAYAVLAQGLLSGKYDINTKFSENDRRYHQFNRNPEIFQKYMKEIENYKKEADLLGISLSHYAISSILADNRIAAVITGIKSSQQLLENIQVLQ